LRGVVEAEKLKVGETKMAQKGAPQRRTVGMTFLFILPASSWPLFCSIQTHGCSAGSPIREK
jgi:hypothetical protein